MYFPSGEKVIFHSQFSSIHFLFLPFVSIEYNVHPSEYIIVPLPPPIGVGVIVGVYVGRGVAVLVARGVEVFIGVEVANILDG